LTLFCSVHSSSIDMLSKLAPFIEHSPYSEQTKNLSYDIKEQTAH
jgi:hypothetical protein